jgi:hypothetical protein
MISSPAAFATNHRPPPPPPTLPLPPGRHRHHRHHHLPSCCAALLSSHCPITALPSCCLIALAGCCIASCRTALLLSFTVPPSCHLAPAGCCVASRHTTLSSSHCASLSSFHHPITAPPSCCLISPAGCCVASHCTAFLLSSCSAALSLSCSGWLLRQLSSRRPLTLTLCHPLILSLSYHCADLLLSHCTGWLLHRLLLHCPLVVLSPRRPLVILLWLVVAFPPVTPPSCPLVVPPSCHFFVLSLWHPLVVSSHRLIVTLPLVVPPTHCLLAPLLSRHLAPAGYCVNSRRAALSSSRRATSSSSHRPITALTSCCLIALVFKTLAFILYDLINLPNIMGAHCSCSKLPMGLKCLPNFAQETMENIFHNIHDAEVYIDDTGAFSQNWEHHLKLLCTILTKLQENGCTVNPLKCNGAVKETDWLGYWLTPTSLKPWKKKIDAVLKMEAPKTLKELRGFFQNEKLLP